MRHDRRSRLEEGVYKSLKRVAYVRAWRAGKPCERRGDVCAVRLTGGDFLTYPGKDFLES
jgi:hypothetical protein